jgi:hypothetical protein
MKKEEKQEVVEGDKNVLIQFALRFVSLKKEKFLVLFHSSFLSFHPNSISYILFVVAGPGQFLLYFFIHTQQYITTTNLFPQPPVKEKANDWMQFQKKEDTRTKCPCK